MDIYSSWLGVPRLPPFLFHGGVAMKQVLPTTSAASKLGSSAELWIEVELARGGGKKVEGAECDAASSREGLATSEC
jgi:hypothetical protein